MGWVGGWVGVMFVVLGGVGSVQCTCLRKIVLSEISTVAIKVTLGYVTLG